MSLVDVCSPERLKATTDFLGSEKLEDGRERAEIKLGASVHGLEELHPDYGRDGKCSYFFHNLSLVVLICADGEVPARQVNRPSTLFILCYSLRTMSSTVIDAL